MSQNQDTSRVLPLPHISGPANRALDAAGIASLTDLTRFTEREIRNLHGMGPKGLRILAEAMAAHGLRYAGVADVT
jgi:hypothetical protein